MSNAPTNALTHPMNLDFRAPGLGPNGSEAHHFQDGASSRFPMMGGIDHTKTLWSPYHTSYYNWQTNGTSTYHASQTLADWKKGDTGRDQLIFGLSPPPQSTLETDKRLHGQNMFGLTMLNYMMRYNPQWRKKFGSIRCGAILRDKFINYRGIQRPDQTMLEDNSKQLYSTEQNFVIFGRANVPNIWLAQGPKPGSIAGGHVAVGMSLYVIARRHKFVEDLLSQEDQALDPMTRAMAGAPPLRPLDEEELDEELVQARKRRMVRKDLHDNALADAALVGMFDDIANVRAEPIGPLGTPLTFGQVATAVELGREDFEMGIDTEPDSTEYYWSFDPWTSVTRTDPTPELYTNANGQGYFIHIGQVSHIIKGENNRTGDSHQLACEATYATERNDAYQRPLLNMDKLEMMAGVGRVGP